MLPTITMIHPSRGRPQKARQAHDLWLKMTNDKNIDHVLCLDKSDPKAYQYEKKFADTGSRIVMNDNRTMVDATNSGLKYVDDGIIITLYDDMEPIAGWDSMLADAYLPGYLISVTDPDSPNLQTVCCGCAIVFKKWGYIYYPGYLSMFADNDYQEHGLQDNLFVSSQMTIRHNHPAHGMAKTDATYERQNHNAAYRLGNILLAGRRVRKFAW